MSKFVSYIGIIFAKFAEVSEHVFSDRYGIMLIVGEPVSSVVVNEDRTISVRVDSEYKNHYTFTREQLAEAKYVSRGFHVGYWNIDYNGEPVAVSFYKDVSHEVMQSIQSEMYDYD